MGEKILVRLRPYNSPTWFYDIEDIVGTMLHELTHNVHGPHDDKFYRFLGEIQEEYYNLKRTGYAGEGFHGPGQRLGTSPSVPQHVARVKALEAAQKRRQGSQVLGNGASRKLGGPSSTCNLSPRELAALAAERRLRDARTCGSQQGAVLAERESAKATREGVTNNVIDLTMVEEWEPDWISDPESDSDEIIIVKDIHPTPGSSTSKGKAKAASSANTNTKLLSTSAPTKRTTVTKPLKKPAASLEWTCPSCTLINLPTAGECDACTMRRPLDDAVGWGCLVCGEVGMEHMFWSCRSCGTIKSRS